MIDVVYYLFNSFGISRKSDRLMLPEWVKVTEKRFNEILSTVTRAKNEGEELIQMEEKLSQIIQKAQ